MIFLGVVSFMMLIMGLVFLDPFTKRSKMARVSLQVLCGLGGAGCAFVVFYGIALSQIAEYEIAEYDIKGWVKGATIIIPYLISIVAGILMGILPGKFSKSE